ncbi:hypothetical protein SLE2022_076120 [Rubroshorea leprosula]
MDAFRKRRSKIAGVARHPSSTDLLASNFPASLRGNRQVQKQRNFLKLASDSSSCSSDTTEEDSFMVDLRWRSSRKSFAMPMKKLLAEEMSKENESRRRSPSVIARLMGLDGLPPLQYSHKQQKGSFEDGQQKAQKNCTFSSRRSSRKNSKDEQDFKDVFEVTDSKKVESTSYSSQETGNSNHAESEMAFIRHKFMDVKRFSTDENLQHSKEFDDALEVLDSNKDLLLKFLQQPDSLFTKHLHDLQNCSPESHCGHISAMKFSHSPNHENISLGQKLSHTLINENSSLSQRTDRESRWKNHGNFPQNHQADILSHPCAVQNHPKTSKVRVEEKKELASLPTRIVVLKPNLDRSYNAARISSSPSPSHHQPSDCKTNTEIVGLKNREVEVWGKKRVSDDLGILRPNSWESREIAKEIARKMRNTSSNGSVKFSTSKLRGYAGDESSCDISGSESANDSDVTTVTSRENSDRNNRHRSPSSHSSESPVSREAKKRLSERWKMTCRSQEICVTSRGRTLGEMLAKPDREVKPAKFSGMIEEGSHRFGSDDGSWLCGEPLGISSRDGWKDECLSKLSRSRSLPASADFGNPGTSLHRGIFCGDKYVVPRDGRNRDRNKAVKGNFSLREGSLSKSSRAGVKKSQFLSTDNNEKNDTPPEVDLPSFMVESNLEEDGQPAQNPVVSEASTSTVTVTSSFHENEENVNNQNMAALSEPIHLELSASSSVNGDFSTGDLDTLASQDILDGLHEGAPSHHPEPQLKSHTSSKEADQPSPVSVIEAPFVDDLSSGSECFESLSADLHGLRTQLKLLKLESEAYAEGSMLVSSDDDADEVSSGFAYDRGMLRAEENLESSYITDVLIDSGISGTDPDTFMVAWYSPDCPVNPFLFEELEKKYCNLTSWSRAERKLIFDRLNSKLLEMNQQIADQHPWVKPARRIHPNWNKRGLEDSLCKLLVGQDKKVKKDATDKVLGSESEWLELGHDSDDIGREIERLLIDELVAEVAAM